MPRKNVRAITAAEREPGPIDTTARVAIVQAVDSSDAVFIDGSQGSRVRASIATHCAADLVSADDLVGKRVVVVFENGDADRPVIVGIVANSIAEARRANIRSDSLLAQLVVDGRKMKIAAVDEISLSCGKAQITLRKDGKVILRGTDVVSRSSGSNRLRGATVKIN